MVSRENIALSTISTPSSAASLFFAAFPPDCCEERIFVLPLDGSGRILAKPLLVSVGHEDRMAQIDVGAIFREALKAGAEEIIVAHNHPSGDLTPSKADIAATAKLREAADLLGVSLLDHLILGQNGEFVSLAERGFPVTKTDKFGTASLITRNTIQMKFPASSPSKTSPRHPTSTGRSRFPTSTGSSTPSTVSPNPSRSSSNP